MCGRVALNFIRRTCHLVTTAAVHAPTLNISSKKRIAGVPVTSCHEGINELMKRNTAHVTMNVTQAVRVALAARSQSGATLFVWRLGADMDSRCNACVSGGRLSAVRWTLLLSACLETNRQARLRQKGQVVSTRYHTHTRP